MAKSVLFWLFAFFMAYGQIWLTASDQKPYCNTGLDRKRAVMLKTHEMTMANSNELPLTPKNSNGAMTGVSRVYTFYLAPEFIWRGNTFFLDSIRPTFVF